jgi:hypothetical protein
LVTFAKGQVVAFSSDALVNLNLLLIRGAVNNTCGTVACELNLAMETAIAGEAPTPHAVLQRKDECEVQSVPVQEVADNKKRMDADAWP